MNASLNPKSLPINHPNCTFSIGRVSLSGFRNYTDLRLDVHAAPIVLTGDNGSGKTNLLEAISLLVPGRGLRRASTADLPNHHIKSAHGFSTNWAVAVDLNTSSGPIPIGTGRDPEATDIERRIVHIDGKPIRSQAALAEHVAMTWITPEMDRVLADGP